MSEASAGQETTRIEAPSSSDPFIRKMIIALVVLGFGIYTIIDHYFLGNFKDDPDFNLHMKFLFNHYIPYLLVPMGLAILVLAMILRSRRLQADGNGIGYAGKPRIAWNEITKVDATLLAEKGLLTIFYGQGKKWKLDSYNFRNFKAVVAFLEKHVPADKISK
jgi:hypothetical protein